jgi:hypothetical protein
MSAHDAVDGATLQHRECYSGYLEAIAIQGGETAADEVTGLARTTNKDILDPDGDIVRRLKGSERAKLSAKWSCYHTELYEFTQQCRPDRGLLTFPSSDCRRPQEENKILTFLRGTVWISLKDISAFRQTEAMVYWKF